MERDGPDLFTGKLEEEGYRVPARWPHIEEYDEPIMNFPRFTYIWNLLDGLEPYGFRNPRSQKNKTE